MKQKLLKQISGIALAIMLTLTFTQILVSAQDPQDTQNVQRKQNSGTSSANARKIEGVWDAQVIIRACQTGNSITTFKAMSMFISGGSLMDTNATPPNTRGPGFGRWQYLGKQQYTAKFRFFMYNPDGTFAGVRRVTRNITLSPEGNDFTGTVSTETFDANGNLIANGCATETAKRVE